MVISSVAASQLFTAEADLSLALLRNATTSTVLSPLSLAITLSMMYAGADGETRPKLSRVLSGGGQELDEETVLNFYGDTSLIVSSNVSPLRSANNLFVNRDVRISDAYKQLVKKYFNITFNRVSFSNAQETATIVNDFVKEKTHNKISNFILADDIDPETKLMPISAAYFSGNWMIPFDPSKTKKATFYMSEGITRQVDMITAEDSIFSYFQNDEFQMLSFNYLYDEDSDLGDPKIVVLLPRQRYGLSATLATLNGKELFKCLKSMRYNTMMLSFPMFRIDSEHRFTNMFKQMGVQLSGIVTNAEESMKIDEVLHKTFIEVNENGTLPALAEGYDDRTRAGAILDNTIEFRADHPFAFFIVNKYINSEPNEYSNVLLAGVVA